MGLCMCVCVCVRYICLACDCLEPQGNDKSGCCNFWVAYCYMVHCPSRLSNFRAALTIFFRQRLASISTGTTSLTVLASAWQCATGSWRVFTRLKSDANDYQIIALGILYFRVTAPYWLLLGQKIHFLDFYEYVVKLHCLLSDFAQDSSPAFQPDFIPPN